MSRQKGSVALVVCSVMLLLLLLDSRPIVQPLDRARPEEQAVDPVALPVIADESNPENPEIEIPGLLGLDSPESEFPLEDEPLDYAAADRADLVAFVEAGEGGRPLLYAVYQLINRFAGDPEITALLVELSEADDPALAALALWGLAQAKEEAAAGASIQAAMTSDFVDVRLEALRALAAQSGELATEALLGALTGDSDQGVRSQAAVYLGLTRGAEPGVVSQLKETAIYDQDATVRNSAIESLGSILTAESNQALDEVSQRGATEADRTLATAIAEEQTEILESDASTLAERTSEPQDPLTVGAERSHD